MDSMELLKQIYIFRGAAYSDLRALAEIAELCVYAPGSFVYSAGDTADALFVVEVGTVDVVPQDNESAFATIGAGQSFGELSFFEDSVRPASARVREQSHIVKISFERFSGLLTERPEFALVVYRNACAFLAKHFRGMALDLHHRYF